MGSGVLLTGATAGPGAFAIVGMAALFAGEARTIYSYSYRIRDDQ